MSTTYVYVIFDESGSMNGKEREVAQSFNAYIADLKSDGGDYRISATKFDTNFRPIFKGLKLAEVPKMTTVDGGGSVDQATTYQPRGMTALYDAVGKSLTVLPELKGDDKALCVIITDGQENSSHEWTAGKVKELLQRLEASGKWAFVYLAEDQSRWAAEQSAASIGLAGQTVVHAASAFRGASSASLGSATASYHAGATPAAAVAGQTQTLYDQKTATKEPEPKSSEEPWGQP